MRSLTAIIGALLSAFQVCRIVRSGCMCLDDAEVADLGGDAEPVAAVVTAHESVLLEDVARIVRRDDELCVRDRDAVAVERDGGVEHAPLGIERLDPSGECRRRVAALLELELSGGRVDEDVLERML